MKKILVVFPLICLTPVFADEPLVTSLEQHKFGEFSPTKETSIVTSIPQKYDLFDQLCLCYTPYTKKLYSMGYSASLHKNFDKKNIQVALKDVSKQIEKDFGIKFPDPTSTVNNNLEKVYEQIVKCGKYDIRLCALRFLNDKGEYQNTFVAFSMSDTELQSSEDNLTPTTNPQSKLFGIAFGSKVNTNDFKEKKGCYYFKPEKQFCKFTNYWAEVTHSSHLVSQIYAETPPLQNPRKEFAKVCMEVEKMFGKPLIQLPDKDTGAFLCSASLSLYKDEAHSKDKTMSVVIAIKRKTKTVLFSARDILYNDMGITEWQLERFRKSSK